MQGNNWQINTSKIQVISTFSWEDGKVTISKQEDTAKPPKNKILRFVAIQTCSPGWRGLWTQVHKAAPSFSHFLEYGSNQNWHSDLILFQQWSSQSEKSNYTHHEHMQSIEFIIIKQDSNQNKVQKNPLSKL